MHKVPSSIDGYFAAIQNNRLVEFPLKVTCGGIFCKSALKCVLTYFRYAESN